MINGGAITINQAQGRTVATGMVDLNSLPPLCDDQVHDYSINVIATSVPWKAGWAFAQGYLVGYTGSVNATQQIKIHGGLN